MYIHPLLNTLHTLLNTLAKDLKSPILLYPILASTAFSISNFCLILFNDKYSLSDTIRPLATFFMEKITTITLAYTAGAILSTGITRSISPKLAILFGVAYAVWFIKTYKDILTAVEKEKINRFLYLGSCATMVANAILFYQAPSVPAALRLGAVFPLPLTLLLDR